MAALCLLAAACVAAGGPSLSVSSAAESEAIMLEVVDGDSLEGDSRRFRLNGINAPDRGECLADAARARLGDLASEPLELDVISTDQFDRELVDAFNRDGWVNRIMVAEGLALALHVEPADSRVQLLEAMEQARQAGVGLWDPSACGNGQPAPLEIIDVSPNPPGPDGDHLDDETVSIRNVGREAVEMTGFVLRDESTANRFRFPDGLILGPGETLIVTSGQGALGFATGDPIWNNGGDTALLVDNQGRIVSVLAYSP